MKGRRVAVSFKHLSTADVSLMKELIDLFGAAFADDAYESAVVSESYLRNLIAKPHFIALVAMEGEGVVGGLVAYELEKLEQDRREIYIYDLAISAAHRRRGIATNLIQELKHIARRREAYGIFVQADLEDEAAIRLYESLGTRESVYHFDINVVPE